MISLPYGKPNNEMTLGEFKQWLYQFDADRDGRNMRTSKAEIRIAFCNKQNLDSILAYAEKRFNIKIIR
ncbi:hypothetical protein AQUCO_05500012v1 [Aquilegia coerulea]|uniref:Uncharacterized protein n=1 Tax=Aquilegia coerulea TaxID=218851 RepID=A0A2G5CGS9_AQUCA|nr:hypothetical protein AQUCO_05500012v1 [Aquilegia coerulea]